MPKEIFLLQEKGVGRYDNSWQIGTPLRGVPNPKKMRIEVRGPFLRWALPLEIFSFWMVFGDFWWFFDFERLYLLQCWSYDSGSYISIDAIFHGESFPRIKSTFGAILKELFKEQNKLWLFKYLGFVARTIVSHSLLILWRWFLWCSTGNLS